jgi:hypothetical protein
MTNAQRLVKKLEKLGVIVYGASFHILRFQYQEHLNRRAGEAAPTWELLVEPLRHFDKIVENGRVPTFDMPDGTRHTTEIYSHFPLTHILRTPIGEWDIGMDDCDRPRLWVGTKMLPTSWTGEK